MKKLFFLILMMFALTAIAIPVSAANDNEPATLTCLGTERALLNSDGGTREKGYFGSIQAPWVQDHQPFGQWLQQWKLDHCTSNSVRN